MLEDLIINSRKKLKRTLKRKPKLYNVCDPVQTSVDDYTTK